MRHITGERGLVKLVHPGRYVEILREPITAGEVMSKNPRHCITRPDVFKYPWIVIKPESVLPLGKVFFLVPYRTLYYLMQSEEHRHQSTNPLRDPRNRTAPPKTTPSPRRAFAGMTPKHQFQYHHHHHHHLLYPKNRRLNDIAGSHDHGVARRREGGDRGEEFFSPWKGQWNSYWEFLQSERRDLEGASTELDDNQNGGREGSGGSDSEEMAGTLKSCLRKPDSGRKELRLKVSFVLPRKEVDKLKERVRSASARRVRVSDYVNW